MDKTYSFDETTQVVTIYSPMAQQGLSDFFIEQHVDRFTFNLPVVLAPSVVDCLRLFDRCYEFDQPVTIPSGVELCWRMFTDCKNFNSPVTIEEGVKSCMNMFENCISFNQPITLPESVTDCEEMFRGCTSLNQPVNLPKGLKQCNSMFWDCKAFNQPVIIPEGLVRCRNMFRGCESFNQLVNLPNSIKDCQGMFSRCTSLNQPVTLPKNVKECRGFLAGCTSFNQPVTVEDNGEVLDCWNMLSGCTSLNSKVELKHMECRCDNFLQGCTSLEPENVTIYTKRTSEKNVQKKLEKIWGSQEVKPDTNVVLVPPKRSGESTTVRYIKYVLSGNRQFEIFSEEIRQLMPVGLYQKLEELLKKDEFISLELEEETVSSMNVLAIYFDGEKFAIGVTSEWSGMARLYDSGEGKEQVAIRGNVYPRHMVSEDKELLLKIIDDFIKTGKPSKQVKWKNG